MSEINKGGRKPYVPTAEHRKTVLVLSGAGLGQDKIAMIVGCKSEKTLRKHYKDEINKGSAYLEGVCVSTVAKALAAGGSVGLRAAHMLLTMRFGWSQFAPPQTPKTPEIGKKEQQMLAAQNGHEDSGWADLVH